jgi:hypothetical protein
MKKKWADAAASRKPIRSTVHGLESGETLMALSIDGEERGPMPIHDRHQALW